MSYVTEGMLRHTDSFGRFASGVQGTHELTAGRGGWFQVLDGSVSVGDVTLQAGDGAGFTSPEELSFSFKCPAEVLLVDLRMDARRVWE